MLSISETRLKEFSEDSEDLKFEKSSILALQQEKVIISESIKKLSENKESKENELNNRLHKLKGYCEAKAEELHELSQNCELKNKLLEDSNSQLILLQKSKNELEKTLESLQTSKNDLEKEIFRVKDGLKQILPLKVCEEEKEKAINSLKSIAFVLHIENSESLDLKTLLKSIESKHSQLQEDLEKAEKFKINKQKFIEMYESNTKELQDE